MPPQPRLQPLKTQGVRVIKRDNEPHRRVQIGVQTTAVQDQKNVHGREGRALIAVDKRMVLRQAFPKRSGFGDEIGIIAGPFSQLWTGQERVSGRSFYPSPFTGKGDREAVEGGISPRVCPCLKASHP